MTSYVLAIAVSLHRTTSRPCERALLAVPCSWLGVWLALVANAIVLDIFLHNSSQENNKVSADVYSTCLLSITSIIQISPGAQPYQNDRPRRHREVCTFSCEHGGAMFGKPSAGLLNKMASTVRSANPSSFPQQIHSRRGFE